MSDFTYPEPSVIGSISGAESDPNLAPPSDPDFRSAPSSSHSTEAEPKFTLQSQRDLRLPLREQQFGGGILTPSNQPGAHGFRRKCVPFFFSFSLVLGIAACGGGGGGDDLEVQFTYGGAAMLLKESTVVPTITGLRGHRPTCTLVSGSVPEGMELKKDCSITGTPLVAGTFPIVVRLAASGVSNTVDFNESVLVHGPSVFHFMPSSMAVGEGYDIPTVSNLWTASTDDMVTYSVADGSLPAGLSLDAATGRISGTATAEGTYSFRVTAQVVNKGRTAIVSAQSSHLATVSAPFISYIETSPFAGLLFQSKPTLPSGDTTYTFGITPALPAGLSIDPSTGEISGRPTEISPMTDYRVKVTGTTPAGTFTHFINFRMGVESPVYVLYSTAPGRIGEPLSVFPQNVNNSSDLLTGMGLSYALRPGDILPSGISLDAATGEISGTPIAWQPVTGTIDVTVTLYGTSFVVPAIFGLGMQ